MNTIAVIGAGIGGLYLLAELGRTGCRVRLHDISEARLTDISALGSSVGVHTPAIDSLVAVVRFMMRHSFAAEARTLERMGLNGMDASRIRRVVEVGFEAHVPAS